MLTKRGLSILLGASLLVAAAPASATDYIMHFGGMCTTSYQDGKAKGRLANRPGWVSVEGYINVKNSLYSSSVQAVQKLDQYCRGSNRCIVINYSAGDHYTRRALSVYDSGSRWNIMAVYTGAGAGGGSTQADRLLSDVFACDYNNDLNISYTRSNFNHHDTAGKPIYHIAGTKNIWYMPSPKYDVHDGLVEFHSGVACASAGDANSSCQYQYCCDKKWWGCKKHCTASRGRYSGHYYSGSYNYNHADDALKNTWVNRNGW